METTGPLGPADVAAALSHLPLAVGLVDARGAVRYANRAAEQLYGWRVEDVLGKSALALGVAPSDTAAAADLLSRLHLGETWHGRFPVRRSDGTRVSAWVSVVSLPADAGEAEPGDDVDEPWLMIVAADVADLDGDPPADLGAAEERAEQANLLLEGFLDSVPLGLAFWDRSLRYVRVNDALAAINGLPAEAHVGRTPKELMQGLPGDVADDIESVFASGETLPQREVVVSSSSIATERAWLVSYFPVRRGGEVLWVGGVALDVTDWRQSESERARLLQREREARRAAEQSAERLARLQVVTGRLAEATGAADVADVAVRHGSAGVGAVGAAMCLVEDGELRVVRAVGMDEAAVTRFGRIPVDADMPAADAFRRGAMVLLGSIAERDERYPSMAGVAASNRSFAAVPMLVDGDAIGVILLGWPEERTFDDGESHFLLALGRQAAQALERARLYDAERRARAAAEEAGERMRFLAEASRVLSSSLDYEVTLAEMARLAVPEVGDVCLVHLIEGDELRLVVAAHHDPDLTSVLAGVVSGPTRHRQPQLLGRAAIMGESIVLDEVPDELLQRVAEDEAQLAALRSLDLRSGVVVPLRVQDRILGVLTIGADGWSGRRFDRDDLPFVEDLAGRAAVAVENSRSHQARTEVAQTLQRSLLPPHLPVIPGLDLAQRYHSVGDVEVGGDFFDVFPAGDGRWGVVMGDVCGKGVAAASLTALARYTVRAGAIEGEPAAVLRLLNRAIIDADVGERFCTIAHAMIEPRDGSMRVVLACGGHPLPLLLTAAGEVRSVGAPGTAIGLFDEIEVTEVELELGPGDGLVLFTDGFVEARSPDGRFDPGLVARALASAAGRTAEGIADAVDAAVQEFQEGRNRDDMALLVLRVRS